MFNPLDWRYEGKWDDEDKLIECYRNTVTDEYITVDEYISAEAIHAHQTSENAVVMEAEVREVLDGSGCIYVGFLPAALIGKRVRCIIEVIEEDRYAIV